MSENRNQAKKILYVRCAPYVINFDNYNLQEVGLGNAFCRKGYDFNLVYYSKENRDQIIEVGENKLTILWRKGIKILRTGIYPFLLDQDFLNQYDIIIVSEYGQLMSHLIAQRHSNVYLYNGPYYNLFKIPFVELIYDRLFCKKINFEMKKIFCKTQMAKEFIGKKGLTNTVVTGVGLDVSKFDAEKAILPETQDLMNKMYGKRNLLYVGSIIPRKNTELIIKTFVELKKNTQNRDLQLVLVGKGDVRYIQKCKELIPDEMREDVVWCAFIKNAQLKYIYKAAYAFLLPSVQEIFGMVLLEAMYFGIPVVSSHSAGAGTLIQNGVNGLIVEQFDVMTWKVAIESVINNGEFAEKLGRTATETIKQDFMWDSIANKMLEYM